MKLHDIKTDIKKLHKEADRAERRAGTLLIRRDIYRQRARMLEAAVVEAGNVLPKV